MTDPFDIEPILDDWFGEGSDVLPDRSVEAVLRTVGQTTQRGAWRAPWRVPSMNGIPRLVAAGAALVAILVVAARLLFLGGPSATGVGGGVATPSPAPTAAPSPTSSGTATQSATPVPSKSAFGPPYQTPLGLAIVGLDGAVRQDLKMPADAWGPDLTADGQRVAFLTRSIVGFCGGCTSRVRPAILEVGKADGLFVCCDIDGFGQAAWSPDGTMLAYQHTGADGNVDVYVVPVIDDGSGLSGSVAKRLTTDPAHDGWPAWSPDGRTIYYTNDGVQAADADGFSATQEIWRVPATGGSPQRLTNNAVADLQPDVAADGTVVYWEDGEIRTMAADGSGQRRLAAIPLDIGFNPRWSPDGSKIALLRYDPSKRARFDPAIHQPSDLPLLAVVVVDPRTGATTTVGPRVASFFNPVSWTPDGTALLINRYDDGP